jgi:hypothetical protein
MVGDGASFCYFETVVAWEDDAEVAHLGVPLDDPDTRFNTLQLKEASKLVSSEHGALVHEARVPRGGEEEEHVRELDEQVEAAEDEAEVAHLGVTPDHDDLDASFHIKSVEEEAAAEVEEDGEEEQEVEAEVVQEEEGDDAEDGDAEEEEE